MSDKTITKLTDEQLSGIEQNAKDYMSNYGDLQPTWGGPPTPGQVLALVTELRHLRALTTDE
jgi:hypothetical protein